MLPFLTVLTVSSVGTEAGRDTDDATMIEVDHVKEEEDDLVRVIRMRDGEEGQEIDITVDEVQARKEIDMEDEAVHTEVHHGLVTEIKWLLSKIRLPNFEALGQQLQILPKVCVSESENLDVVTLCSMSPFIYCYHV